MKADIYELAEDVAYCIRSRYADLPENVRESLELAHAHIMAAGRTAERAGEREASDDPDAIHKAVRQGYAMSRLLGQEDQGMRP